MYRILQCNQNQKWSMEYISYNSLYCDVSIFFSKKLCKDFFCTIPTLNMIILSLFPHLYITMVLNNYLFTLSFCYIKDKKRFWEINKVNLKNGWTGAAKIPTLTEHLAETLIQNDIFEWFVFLRIMCLYRRILFKLLLAFIVFQFGFFLPWCCQFVFD